jgi:phosphate starvation-inducible PhoH-like protein
MACIRIFSPRLGFYKEVLYVHSFDSLVLNTSNAWDQAPQALLHRKGEYNLSKKRNASYARRNNRQYDDFINDNVVHLVPTQPKRKVELTPRNANQRQYINLLNDWSKTILFAVGPAGTGKTMLAVQAAIRSFNAKEIDKIIVTRPAVSVDEEHGFLPGTLTQKMEPWTKPIFDVFQEHWSQRQIEYFLEEGKIEISPLAYMRGRTFKRAWIIADEMQNATASQMKMLLTRIGDDSRMVVTGDLRQGDRIEDNGLADFLGQLARSEGSRSIALMRFEMEDVERHQAVKEVLKIYGDE